MDLTALLAACGGRSAEDDLRGRVDVFFEAVLTEDATSVDDYISDSCPEKEEFLELVSAAPAFEDADVGVPEGAFWFDVEGEVAVAKRAARAEPVLVNGTPPEDDPSNDAPLKLVLTNGDWRLENCGAYVAEPD